MVTHRAAEQHHGTAVGTYRPRVGVVDRKVVFSQGDPGIAGRGRLHPTIVRPRRSFPPVAPGDQKPEGVTGTLSCTWSRMTSWTMTAPWPVGSTLTTGSGATRRRCPKRLL